MGRITRNLEVRYSTNNMAILKINIAVNRRKKGETDFINCIAFDKNAENIAKFFDKGNLIAIIGHIQTGSYKDKEDKTVYTTDVIIDEWDFTGEKRDGNSQNNNTPDSQEPSAQPQAGQDGFYPMDEDDELPF